MAVPLIDLSAGSPAAVAARIDMALCEHGFFAISGHHVPPAVVEAAFDASHSFFDLPEPDKARWHIDHSPHRRGFDPVGWQSLDPQHPPDLKESFYLGVPHIGPNQWPDECLVPGFRLACSAYTAAMDALAARLLALFEIALGLDAGHLGAHARQPICTTRLLHYPLPPAAPAEGQIGCGAHTDWGALTLLAQDDAGGLQVQHRDGRWLDVPCVPGTFVANVGDLMQRWTNDRWLSTPHRVVNRMTGRERWSIAYFFDLDADAAIVPLTACTSAANPARYGPITPAEHLEAMYRKTTVAA